MHADEQLPALRAIEVRPAQPPAGEPQFFLLDRQGIAPGALAVSAAGYFVLAHLDGQNTCQDVQRAFLKHTGMQLPAEQITRLVQTLDEACLLEGERYERALAERAAAYRAAPARDNRAKYPAADALRTALQQIVASGTPAPVADVRGLIAPHLDYERGTPCYADAYATLAASGPAERYVILGTNHAGASLDIVATTKDFQTPLGLVQTDRAFLAALEGHLGGSLCERELEHDWEHSIELQVHLLQVIQPEVPFEIVPILCPNLCSEFEAGGADPGARLAALAAALRATLVDGRRTVLIAGADLSHIGQAFGDPAPTTEERLAEVERCDQEILRPLVEGNAEAFRAGLCRSGNPTRVCSGGCMYTLAKTLTDVPCRLLRYHQAVDHGQETHVTCMAAVLG